MNIEDKESRCEVGNEVEKKVERICFNLTVNRPAYRPNPDNAQIADDADQEANCKCVQRQFESVDLARKLLFSKYFFHQSKQLVSCDDHND